MDHVALIVAMFVQGFMWAWWCLASCQGGMYTQPRHTHSHTHTHRFTRTHTHTCTHACSTSSEMNDNVLPLVSLSCPPFLLSIPLFRVYHLFSSPYFGSLFAPGLGMHKTDPFTRTHSVITSIHHTHTAHATHTLTAYRRVLPIDHLLLKFINLPIKTARLASILKALT